MSAGRRSVRPRRGSRLCLGELGDCFRQLTLVPRYTPPFDRHDWYVDRCGTQVRYVIDFYTGRPDPARPGVMSFYLDVRPALDDWASVSTRLRGLWK